MLSIVKSKEKRARELVIEFCSHDLYYSYESELKGTLKGVIEICDMIEALSLDQISARLSHVTSIFNFNEVEFTTHLLENQIEISKKDASGFNSHWASIYLKEVKGDTIKN